MASVTKHLLKRAVFEVHGQVKEYPEYQRYDVSVDLKGNPGAVLLVGLTFILFTFAIYAVQYTYGELIATLAAVEAPTTTAIICTDPEDNDAEAEANEPLISLGDKKDINKTTIEQEVLLIKQRPLTSRFCTIRRHLRARGGRLARFRGLGIHCLESILLNATVGFFSSGRLFRQNLVARTFLEVLCCTLLTGLSLWWNNYIISEPSSKSWYSRMPKSTQVRKAFAPTAINAAIQRFSGLAFFYVALQLGAIPTKVNMSDKPTNTRAAVHSALACTALIVLGLFIALAIQLPSTIAITRVRASLLAPEEEPIIPFDRTFNGQVIPTSAGGSGMLGMWQAWTGTDRQTCLRVLGVYLKTFAMQLSLVLIGALAIAGEIRLLLGPDYAKKLTVIAAQTLQKM